MSVTTRTLRFTLGWIIMLAHFIAIAAFIVLGFPHLELEGVLAGIGTVAPLGAIYLAAFVNYVVTYPAGAPDDANMISAGSMGVQVFLVGLFAIALVLAPVIILTISPTGNVEHATTLTGTIDTLFAGYIGLIFKRLFPFADK